MNHRLRALVALTALLSAAALQATEVAVCTDRGRAVIELEDAQAPQHVANFLRYVDTGLYSGTVFHRVLPERIVQGGGFDRQLRMRATLPPVANEASNGLRNERGTVAAARTEDPDSAQSQFYVNLRDNSQLDELRYTVFGRVAEGMEVFDAIGRLPTSAGGMFPADVPTPLVAMTSIARIDAAVVAALPADGREAALEAQIAAAAESGNAEAALRLVGHYRALCGVSADVGLTEGRMALAVEDRRRALLALAEVLATTEASQPAYAAAAELYREAAEDPVGAELLRACSPPAVPAVPDGSVVTAAEMVASQRQVRDFVAAGEAYGSCLATIIDDDERPAALRNAAVNEHNRMVAAMEEVAAAFNEQVRLFRARG